MWLLFPRAELTLPDVLEYTRILLRRSNKVRKYNFSHVITLTNCFIELFSEVQTTNTCLLELLSVTCGFDYSWTSVVFSSQTGQNMDRTSSYNCDHLSSYLVSRHLYGSLTSQLNGKLRLRNCDRGLNCFYIEWFILCYCPVF